MSERLSENKIILVTRQSRLDELVRRFNTVEQARFYVEHLGADFSDYQLEHHQYLQATRAAEASLGQLGRVQRVDRRFVPNFVFGERDVVVALGQDGLVANVMKYLDRQTLLGVNPDPARCEGVLLPFSVQDLPRVIPEVFAGRRPIREVTMASVSLNTGETLHAVNDFFIGPRSHTSARYQLNLDGRTEVQSSSGIIVSTGLGSTGWMRSVIAGAGGISSALAGHSIPLPNAGYDWSADHLFFSVREPWPSKTSQASITFGKITHDAPLELTSQMAEHGVIFSDGIEADFLQFNAGTRATVGVAERRGHLAE